MMPARQAIIPQLVGPEKTTNAMALNAAGISGTTMAAPALAGGVYAFIGPWNVFYLIGALTLAAVVLTSFLPRTGPAGASSGSTNVVRDIADGISHVWQRRILLVLLLMGLAATMLAMPFRFILPVFVVDIYRQGPDSMGLLVGLMGLGSMLGSLYVASMGQRYRGIGLIVASFMSGVGLVLIAAIPVYSAAAMIMVLLGIGDSGRQALNQTLIIELASPEYRGRIMSLFMLNYGLMPLSITPAGYLTGLPGRADRHRIHGRGAHLRDGLRAADPGTAETPFVGICRLRGKVYMLLSLSCDYGGKKGKHIAAFGSDLHR